MERVIYGSSAMPATPQRRSMEQAGRYEGELDARKRACPVRWRGKALSSLDDMLIPLSFKWGRACCYCGKADVPLHIEHINPRSQSHDDRVCNLTLACQPCNDKKGTQDIRVFLKNQPQLLEKLLKQAKTPLSDATAVNATRWILYDRLKALGLPVECGSGGLTKYNRTTRGLPKDHWVDACCVGRSTPESLQVKGVVPLLITANGYGCRQMCNVDGNGFPCAKPKGAKVIKGFQTGDIVKAVVPSGKKQGSYVGRVLVRATGSFDIRTREARVQGISHRFCLPLHKVDGYSYGLGHPIAPPPSKERLIPPLVQTQGPPEAVL